MAVSVPDTMTVVAIREPGGPEVLVPEKRPVVRPDPGELLVEVAAAGVNRPDVFQRQGNYPPPKGASDIPGLEIAGTVVAIGDEVEGFEVGSRVLALVAGGGYAEYCTVPAATALPIPDGLSMIQAAAVPETFFTVWSNVFDRGRLRAGERFLVHGGTSGIGTTAIQLAKAFGAFVMTTAGSDDKLAACRKLGADVGINYRTTDFVSVVKEATDGHGADLILDMVGGSYVERNWQAAATEGRIVQIAVLEGASEQVDFRRLMMKRLTHTGSTLRARDIAFKAEIAAALKKRVWPLLADGTVGPVIDSTFPLAEAAEAHRRMESSGHVGKIVLVVREESAAE
ncbi:NAD(P)H-quinone oxidoreductase [Amorphus orientalis]|uniref:PIG3 family NAD(P)H quinone oxidoreductase n=1 Tax=Amorphus orientalis TaxID=649198 RepID=A0AAE3VLF5_9HYPH|nr:NAD(P)H-quinone oxidoreductase [Amorphus orientalis]MDQ0314221.1 putative PIG3 family NAD(P)H quinone oxidoreductase [Amorphus orientalis]